MTQEEKAQRYDKISKEVKDFFEGKQKMYSDVEQTLNHLFPELRGSEDERIKEDLIQWIDDFPDPIWRCHHKKDVIAWLEKQGEQKQDPCEYCKDKCLNCYNFPCIDKRAFEQGKSVFEAIKEEKVDNQNCVKSIYNDEPKFKAEDWIVFTNGNVERIISVGTHGYTFDDGDYLLHDKCDKDAHIWTIQDARDGDVLFMDNGLANCIFIYKSSKNGIISKYASYNNFGFEGDHYLVLNDGYVIPATKEQRDTLFAKMKEAGYTFDFKKKELKKVEQEQDSINPSEYINDIGGNGCYLKNTAQVSAWSEEDEKMVNDIIAAIDTLYYHGMVNWLKSLKERCTRKPSEEQIIALNNAVLLNEDHYNGAVLSTLLEQLKKL